MNRPDPFELTVALNTTDHFLGAAHAAIDVVEYGDFECPNCKQAAPAVKLLLERFAGKVRFVFRHFPLEEVHPHALAAAEAAEAAAGQSKFWEIYDLLFENQSRLNPELIKSLAGKIGLSAAELQRAFDSSTYAAQLSDWKESGNRAGVDATPTLYVNGRKFGLALTPEALQRTVEDEMEWTSNKNGWAPD